MCTHCELCIRSCNHFANSFDSNGKYKVFYHHCTLCHHCAKVCPTGAISLDANNYEDFQKGMAICTNEVLKNFNKDNVFYINFLINITALCDCWGLTTPSLVPDIGIMASSDIVSIERASVDAIKIENLLENGIPIGYKMGTEGHLFERLHGKNPYVQINELENIGLGSQNYIIEEIK